MNMSETGGNPPFSIDIHKFQDALRACSPMKLTGKVTQIIGLVIESQGPTVTVGELCYVSSHFSGMPPVPAEVVGFREGSVLLMPVGEMQGIGPGCEVIATGRRLRVKVGEEAIRLTARDRFLRRRNIPCRPLRLRRSRARAFTTTSTSVYAPLMGSSRSVTGSASASWRAPASANRRCSL